MSQPIDDERKSSKRARRKACSRRPSRNLDDTLLSDLKDVLVKKNKKRTADGSSQQKNGLRHDNIGESDDGDNSVVVLERFPSPYNGKIVSDVEYNPDFLVVRQGQLTSSRLSASKKGAFARTGTPTGAGAAAAQSAASVARGTFNTASHASLPTTKSSSQARSREHRLRRRNKVTDLEYHVDFWDIQDARLFPKADADSVVGGDADVEGNIQPVPAAVCGPEQAESPVAEVPVRKTSLTTRSQRGRGRSLSNFVLEIEKVKEVPNRKPSRRRSRGAKRTSSDSAPPGSPPRRRLRSNQTVRSKRGNQDDEDDFGHIRVGPKYQASIPSRDFVYPHSESSEDHGDVLWDPSLAQAATELGEDVEGCLEKGSEMNAKFLLMEALHKKQYSTKNAIPEFMQLCQERGEFSVELTTKENALARKMFLQQVGMDKQKDFTAISKAVGRNKDTLLVNYYRWKSEGRAYAVAKKGREPEVCSVCDDGGFLLVCDFCRDAFHLECLTPALPECPDGDWSCNRCMDLSPGKPKPLAMSPPARSPRNSIPRKSLPSPARFLSPTRDRSKELKPPPSRSSLFISGNRKKVSPVRDRSKELNSVPSRSSPFISGKRKQKPKSPPAPSSSERRDSRKRELAYVHKELGSPKRGGSSRPRDVAFVAPAPAKKTGDDNWTSTSPSIANADEDWTSTSPSIANADEDGGCRSRSSSPTTPSSAKTGLSQDYYTPLSNKAASTPGDESSASPDTASSYDVSDTDVSYDASADEELLLEDERVPKGRMPKRQTTGRDPTTAHNGTSSNVGPNSAQGVPVNRQDYVDRLIGVSNRPASQGPTRQGPVLTATHDGTFNNIGLTRAQALEFLAARHAELITAGTNQGGLGLNNIGGFVDSSSGSASQASMNQGVIGLNNTGGFAVSSSGPASQASMNQRVTGLNFGGHVSQASTNQMGRGLNDLTSFLATSSGPQASTNQRLTGLNNLTSLLANTSGSTSQASTNQGGAGLDFFHNRTSNNVGYPSAQASQGNRNAYFDGLAATLNSSMSQGPFQWGTGLNAQSSRNIESTLAQVLALRTSGHSGGFTGDLITGRSNVGGPASQGPNRGGSGFVTFQNGISNNNEYSVGQYLLRNGNADALELQMLLRAHDDRVRRANSLPF
jgi:hypothetical protein